jgi:hypothetical protein
MERYVEQLLGDIAYATENVDWPYREQGLDIDDWMPDDEEERAAPVRLLEEWTGIHKAELPPVDQLNDEQVQRLLEALKALLDAHNWSFVLQTPVPERIQYASIRDNFDQEAKVKLWHTGFFQLCRPGTPHGECALGEHCQCRFYEEFWAGFVDDDLSPEEERARHLQIEIEHLKKKHGDDWEKYYPYHLDAGYDDEQGNPYDYGLGLDDEDDSDGWWRG